jgi:hypothetical protein
LKEGRVKLGKPVVVETTIWSLLKAAKLDESGKSCREAEAAIERLTKPVSTYRYRSDVEFPALLKSVQREGSKLRKTE